MDRCSWSKERWCPNQTHWKRCGGKLRHNIHVTPSPLWEGWMSRRWERMDQTWPLVTRCVRHSVGGVSVGHTVRGHKTSKETHTTPPASWCTDTHKTRQKEIWHLVHNRNLTHTFIHTISLHNRVTDSMDITTAITHCLSQTVLTVFHSLLFRTPQSDFSALSKNKYFPFSIKWQTQSLHRCDSSKAVTSSKVGLLRRLGPKTIDKLDADILLTSCFSTTL